MSVIKTSKTKMTNELKSRCCGQPIEKPYLWLQPYTCSKCHFLCEVEEKKEDTVNVNSRKATHKLVLSMNQV